MEDEPQPSRRSRAWLIAGAAGLVLAAFFGTRTLTQVPENSDSIRRLCLAINEENRKQVALWEFVIQLSPKPTDPVTAAAQEERTVRFRAYVNETFKQQDCPEP